MEVNRSNDGSAQARGTRPFRSFVSHPRPSGWGVSAVSDENGPLHVPSLPLDGQHWHIHVVGGHASHSTCMQVPCTGLLL